VVWTVGIIVFAAWRRTTLHDHVAQTRVVMDLS